MPGTSVSRITILLQLKISIIERTNDMPLLKEKTAVDLSKVSEVDMIKELYNRDISSDYILGAYYAMGEQESHNLDVMFGSSEAGLHGRDSYKPKGKK